MGAKRKSAEEYNSSGWVNRVKHNLEKAEEDFRQALKLDPDHLLAVYGLALILMEQGDKKAAVKHFKKVATLLEGGAADDDPIRGGMLRRQALGHVERLTKGNWNLLSIGIAIPKE